MAQDISHLEIVWCTRSGGGGRTERKYLDFVVDSQSLGELLKVGDMISCLGWGTPEYEAIVVQELLLKKPSPLQTSRVMLYVCPECGDIGCGAITAQVEETEEHFVLRSFAYENNYDPGMPDMKKYQALGPYLFNKADYWQALNQRSV